MGVGADEPNAAACARSPSELAPGPPSLRCTGSHLELITQDLAIDLSGDALVVEVAQLGLVVDLNLLLAARRRVCDVQLHS